MLGSPRRQVNRAAGPRARQTASQQGKQRNLGTRRSAAMRRASGGAPAGSGGPARSRPVPGTTAAALGRHPPGECLARTPRRSRTACRRTPGMPLPSAERRLPPPFGGKRRTHARALAFRTTAAARCARRSPCTGSPGRGTSSRLRSARRGPPGRARTGTWESLLLSTSSSAWLHPTSKPRSRKGCASSGAATRRSTSRREPARRSAVDFF
jgi:hypothetical protein